MSDGRSGWVRTAARSVRRFWRFWIDPVFPVGKLGASVEGYTTYLRQWSHYSRLARAEPLRFEDAYPQIFDRTAATGFDAHYLYQAVWAMGRVAALRPRRHIDVGSDVRYVTMLTTHLPVVFVDIRPLHASLSNWGCLSGDLLSLPFARQVR